MRTVKRCLGLGLALCLLGCGGKNGEPRGASGPAPASDAGTGELPSGAIDVVALEERYGPYLSDVVELAVGVRTSCAVHADGRVSCWGADWLEVLGRPPALAPRFVEGISDAVAVAVAFTAACAITRNGEVSCWGSGPVANDAPEDEWQYTAPSQVQGLSNVSALVAAQQHMCALAEGRIACWGEPTSLGSLFGRTGAAAPYWIGEVEGVSAFAVFMGLDRCELIVGFDAGAVDCIGAEFDDAPFSGRFRREPMGVTASAIDGRCLVSDGEVQCFGRNATGQLARPYAELEGSESYVQIAGLRDMVQVAVGDMHTCALDAGGRVWCWGGNSQAQLGQDYRSPALLEPTPLSLAQRVTQLDAGDLHTCALLEERHVVCWGYNAHGEIGEGSLRPALVPTPVRATR